MILFYGLSRNLHFGGNCGNPFPIRMKLAKFALSVFLFATPFFLATVVFSAPPSLEVASLSTPGTSRTLNLPPAADNSPVIYLGTATDPTSGQKVEGYAYIFRRGNLNSQKSSAKPTANLCYTYLARSTKWQTVEPWLNNPTNLDGLDPATVFNLLSTSVFKWEEAADGNVSNGVGVDVLGEGTMTTDVLVADTAAPDGLNEAYFADVSDSNAIAVTIVWGIFSGPPSGRKLIEWDQVYDDVSFDWSAEALGVSGKMDFDNIATHEIGHSFGLGDLYNSCTEETMYGYAASGETKKRDLNGGDIAGVNKLY